MHTTDGVTIIQDYKVIVKNRTYLLEEEVKYYMKHGWKLYGGLEVSATPGWIKYAQAMVRVREAR